MSDPALVIAEVGLNHNGNFELAVASIEAAAQSGADAVKFQNYQTEDFIFDRTLTYSYRDHGKDVTETMWDLCKRCEMPREWIPRLKEICDRRNVMFLSTPTSETGIRDLVDAGVPMLKNGSDFLTHLALLRCMGATGLPVIVSTGMADDAEIGEAVAAVREGGPSKIVLLHCTSAYPTYPADVNLRRMTSLRDRFKVDVGFSDHTIGSAAAIQAVSLGARVLEKHFTVDHDLPGPDHWFSLNPAELKGYMEDIRSAEARLGSASITPSKAETQARIDFRLSLVAAKPLPKGHRLAQSDFVISKPGTGLPPKMKDAIVGKTLARPLERGMPITAEDVA